jgi:uncharacterized membrane protein SpoIIM required for sporulation
LLVVMLFSLFYRRGGLLLIICWNASVWGVVFSYLAFCLTTGPNLVKALHTLLTIYLSVFIHLILESLAYILAGMSGLFLSKASIKYFSDQVKLNRVVRAVIILLVLSLLLIALSALIESSVSPHFFGCWSNLRLLFKNFSLS